MANLGNAKLIKRLRSAIGQVDPEYSGFQFYIDMYDDGDVSQNTVRKAERGESCSPGSFEGMATGFSRKFLEIYSMHRHAAIFNSLKSPDLGWLIERLERGDQMPIRPEELIVNHEERYLVKQYKIRLAVRPSVGKTALIPRAGQPPETFQYDDMATVTYEVTFSEDNRREEPGFRLAYGTHNGRIKLLEPDEERLSEDKAYRLHKRNAVFEPSPCVGSSHRMKLMVYGGYAKDDEAAHFSMSQHAYYQNVTFSLDLSAYPEAAMEREPALIIVPVLKDRKLDCCDIARKGQGLPVEPDRLDLRLMPALNDVRALPKEGKYLIIVAAVNNLLHFRSFDGHGNMVVDSHEKKLTESTREIEDLKQRLNSLWPLQELTSSQKDEVIAAITPIVGYMHRNPRQNGRWQWSFADQMNVMICVRWGINHSQIGQAATPTDDQLVDFVGA